MSKFKVGDKIRRVSNPAAWAPLGYETVVASDGHSLTYTDKQGDRDVLINNPDWELVKSTGPVRTVTRREIVPGDYGIIEVMLDRHGQLEIGLNYTRVDANDLRSAAMIFSQLAEALDENKGDKE